MRALVRPGAARTAPAMLADLVARFAAGLSTMFVESALYILVGFAVAGLLHVWVPETFIRRVLGHGRIGSIFTAALLGIPLPLCSCSVLPTAIAMRRMGASRGATVSYLISEPETGPDSIAITYGLMGPLIAVYRPAAALVAAMVAGLIVEWRGGPERGIEGESGTGGGAVVGSGAPACADHDHAHDHDHFHDHAPAAARARDWRGWLRGALRYGFVDLLDDLSHWLFLGLVIGASVTAFVPASAIGGYLGSGFVPLVLMAVIGVPIYICAAASTPIAAALVLKGLSPGAALVLLLTGPATNLGSIAVLVRHLGRRVVAIHLAVVVVVSIAAGALLDAIYALLGRGPEIRLGGEPGWLPGWVSTGSAVLLAALLARSFVRTPIPGELVALARGVERATGVRLDRARVAWGAATLALAAWLSTSVTVIEPGERGVRLTLGRVTGELTPGVHVGFPAPVSRAVVTSVAASRVVDLVATTVPGDASVAPATRAAAWASDRHYLTGDRDVVEVEARVEFRAADPVGFALAVRDPEALVRSTARAALIGEIGRTPIDELYTGTRAAVARNVTERLERDLAVLGAGVSVEHVSLLHVRAPAPVLDAFRQLASAREEAGTAVEVARGERDVTISRARAGAVLLARESAAGRHADVARASAEAHAFALQSAAVGDWRPLVELRLWLETAEAVLPGKTKIVRSEGAPGSGAGIDVWLGGQGVAGVPPPLAPARAGSGGTR